MTCISCGREMNVDDYGRIDGGVVTNAVPRLGSRHKGNMFFIYVCDDCLDLPDVVNADKVLDDDEALLSFIPDAEE
jgi:hypothetical protein